MNNNLTYTSTNSHISLSSPKRKPTGLSPSFNKEINLPEVLLITSYPPRECGIATYSQDLIDVLRTKFKQSFTINICPLESANEQHQYATPIQYALNTDQPNSFIRLANKINQNDRITLVMIQHEFGFFEKKEKKFIRFLEILNKPIVIVFHTVLPGPNIALKKNVEEIANAADSIIVMTTFSKNILISHYSITPDKIVVIPHGTHLLPHADKATLKSKYQYTENKILSTFGLLSSGKGIETTLEAMPAILLKNPETLFLIIGKTHPSVLKREGEQYRLQLEKIVEKLKLEKNVQFINQFLPLSTLLEYLQLTDIYLFTSRDPNQAVSGTFSYAIGCGCPVISTPIPHAKEVLKNDAGLIIDFGDSAALSNSVSFLLSDDQLRMNMGSNGLHKMASTAWENAAIAHAKLFDSIAQGKIKLEHTIPAIKLNHIKKLTTQFGMIQFAKINQPDLESGYTLDDNARALVALCQHYELTRDESDLELIHIYYKFIRFCLQPIGRFLNYVDIKHEFTEQNNTTNLSDSNGRAIWALGYLASHHAIMPSQLIQDAASTMQFALTDIAQIHSTRAMAFAIKGLYYFDQYHASPQNTSLINLLANRLVQMYKHEADHSWRWFESYLTYANSIIPEALLCAWLVTKNPVYKDISKESFDFLMSRIYLGKQLKVVSNKGWLHKGKEMLPVAVGGEQPIDVAYTIMALRKFYEVFRENSYLKQMKNAFNWFLGDNHLNQIIYNPSTGGCYDGLEENYVNLNQGAESTVSYLMARLTVEQYLNEAAKTKRPKGFYLQYNM